MNPTRTFDVLIPSLRAHHLQTPKDFISKKRMIFYIIPLYLRLSNLPRKISIFSENSNTYREQLSLENRMHFGREPRFCSMIEGWHFSRAEVFVATQWLFQDTTRFVGFPTANLEKERWH